MNNINKLAIEYNVDSYIKFVEFCNKNLPDKEKYPLLNNVLKSTAENYFENCFCFNNPFYPIAEACKSSQKNQKRNGILYKQLNLLISIFVYILRLITLVLLKNNFVKFRFAKCSLISNKKFVFRKITSSNIYLNIKVFNFQKRYKIKEGDKFHKFLRKILCTTLSPFTIIILFLITLPVRFNYHNIQKIKNYNSFFLALSEFLLTLDLKISIKLINDFSIKKFITSGWFSAEGSILFESIKKLGLESFVVAHGYLGGPSLSFFYPILSDSMCVFSKEEMDRLSAFDKLLKNSRKKIYYIYKSPNLYKKNNIKLLKLKIKKIKTIVFALSGSHILTSGIYYEKYKKLISRLLILGYSIYYKPHHQDDNYLKVLQSMDGKIDMFKDNLENINIKNTMIIGANSTLLLETKKKGILTIQLSDFSTCISSIIKSVITLSIEEFLLLIND